MLLRRALLMFLGFLLLAMVAQAVYWWPQLPERMASHFDLNDRVNGWMSRGSFLVLAIGVQALMAATFLALPLLLERLPDSLINVPHKDYWLAPSRREESLAHMTSGLLAVGCATMLLLLVVFHGTYALNAELARGAVSGVASSAAGGAASSAGLADAAGADVVPHLVLPLPFLAVMGLYLAAVAVILAWMLRRFRKPAST